jgi:hypothetical protein
MSWLRQLPLLLAVGVAAGLAHIGTSTMPFQIGALIDGAHLHASQAGVLGFFEVAALATAMILISEWIDRLPPRLIALTGSGCALLANAGLYLVHPFLLQIMLAVLAGTGYGLVFAAMMASAAATAQPDRVYAIGNGGALLLITAVIATLPAATLWWGPLGLFLGLAALALLCAPFFFAFVIGKRTAHTRLAAWRTPGAPGLLFAWAAYSAGAGGLYAFSERVGTSIALAPKQIAMVLTAGVFVGLLGTSAVAVLGRSVNRPKALIIGIMGTGIAGVLAEHTTYSATGVLGFVGCALGLVVGFPSLFRALKAV